jgi:uncharacterized protein HemY
LTGGDGGLGSSMGFCAAEGYAELGLWPEALEELASLAAELRAMPPVLRLEVRCCVAVEAWEQGRLTARQLRSLGPIERMMAAGFYATLGRDLLQRGRKEEAKEAFRDAVDSWPSCKEVVLRDPALVAAML